MIKVYKNDIKGDIDIMLEQTSKNLYLSCSDGTVIQVYFDDFGVWHTHVVVEGVGDYKITPPADDHYSECLEIDADIEWVVVGEKFIMKT